MAGNLVKALRAFGNNDVVIGFRQLDRHVRELTGRNDRLAGWTDSINMRRRYLTAVLNTGHSIAQHSDFLERENFKTSRPKPASLR